MNNIKTNISIIALLFSFTLVFIGCKDDDVVTPHDEHEEELITSVELIFTEGMNSSTFRFADPDGDGGNDPTEMDTIKLAPNTSYTLAVRFLDESTADVEDITEEVLEEADEHLVCYSVHGGTTVTITDKDGNNLDLGLAADVKTGDAESGHFTISLKHQPDVKNGSCEVGETDVEVRFALEVK
ncbi:MAG: hypothetical protein ACPGTP_09695 [Bacteroidia bacterium]